jgi:hypothetical protein
VAVDEPKEQYMSIAEILEIERNRKESSTWNVIHLFKEGSFYRAYEWSAWLITVVSFNDSVRNGTQDRKPLTVTRKKDKNSDGTFVFVGFPLNSLDKYIPNGTELKPISDNQIDIQIELSADIGEVSFDAISNKIDEWKDGVPVKEEKQKKGKSDDSTPFVMPSDRPMSITCIMTQIIAYPLEQKSPMEVVAFVSDIRKRLAMLF